MSNGSGRSVEAEIREILTSATLGKHGTVDARDLQAMVDRLYRNQKSPNGVFDELIRERRKEADKE